MTYELTPEGRYPARITDVGAGKAGTGTEQVVIQFELLGPEKYAGRHHSYYGFLTENAIDFALEALENAGWSGNGFTKIDLDPMIGNECQVVIRHKANDKGEMRDIVRFVNKSNGPAVKTPLSSDEAQAVTAKFKGKLLQRQQQRASQVKEADDFEQF